MHSPRRSDKVYYTKQTVGNACGTVGLIHAAANVSTFTGGDVEMVPGRCAGGAWLSFAVGFDVPCCVRVFVAGSFFDKFLTRTLTMTADECAVALEEDDEIEVAHEEVAQEGQSEVVADVQTHFVAFVQQEGHLYELDGRKATPINHGATSDASFLKDAVAVVKQFMERDPGACFCCLLLCLCVLCLCVLCLYAVYPGFNPAALRLQEKCGSASLPWRRQWTKRSAAEAKKNNGDGLQYAQIDCVCVELVVLQRRLTFMAHAPYP